MRASTQLHLSNVNFERPERTVLSDVSMTLSPGDRIGLTGPNGAGKSTLLAVAAGQLTPTTGAVTLVPRTATVGLLRQESEPLENETAMGFISRQLGIQSADRQLRLLNEELARDPANASAEKYDAALQRWLALGGATLEERLGPVLADLDIDMAKLEQEMATLSGGEVGRVGLAIVLLASFDLLLLDEPTNNLDIGGLVLLEEILLETAAPFVVVSHDRRFLERTVTSVIELDSHSGTAKRFEGGWESYEEQRMVSRAQHQRRFDDYEEKKAGLKKRAEIGRQWSEKGARTAKKFPADNDKVRRNWQIETSQNLAAKVRRTEQAIDRLEEVAKPWEPWRLQFRFGETGRSGDVVCELVDAMVQRGEFTLGPITLAIDAGDRIQIVGPNGSGKSTLLSLILGDLPPSRGSRRLGTSVSLGLLDQSRRLGSAEDDRTKLSLLGVVERETGKTTQVCRATLAKFGLTAADVARPSGGVSPGERTRANLAIFQIRGVNTVVLDEPTNHLDVEAIEQLESAISGFDGTLLVVSHDRRFLENIGADQFTIFDMREAAGGFE